MAVARSHASRRPTAEHAAPACIEEVGALGVGYFGDLTVGAGECWDKHPTSSQSKTFVPTWEHHSLGVHTIRAPLGDATMCDVSFRLIPVLPLVLAAIVVLGLGVRIAYLAADSHPGLVPSIEGEMAHNIVDHGQWFVFNERAKSYFAARYNKLVDPATVDFRRLDDHARWQPEILEPVGGAVIAAALWKITGSERYLSLQLLQCIVSALVALLVYRIAWRLFKRRRAALIAATCYALYPPIAQQATIPFVDTWAVDFTVATVAMYLEAINSTYRWRWLIACGVVVGIGLYFRPNLLILPVALALSTFVSAGWRETLRRGAATTAIAVLFVVPWTIRNLNDFHAFVPLRSGLGETMWRGLGEIHNDFGASLEDSQTTIAEVRRVRPNLRPWSPAWDSFLQRWAIRAIERHPLFYLKVTARRTAQTIWQYDPEWMRRGSISPFAYGPGPLAYAVDRPFDLLEAALQPVVVLLAVMTLLLTWRRWKPSHSVLVATVLAVLVPYILLHVEMRYLLPAVVVYLIWIGLGADLLIDRVSTWRKAWSEHRLTRQSPLAGAS